MIEVQRQAARLVVLDQTGRVLLFRYSDDGRTWWATPGGGLEPGETFEAAAVREAAEELSIASVTLTPLWTQTVTFTLQSRRFRQTEQFFLARVPDHEIPLDIVSGEVHRREGIVEARWWPLDGIEQALEPVFPEDLGDRVRSLK